MSKMAMTILLTASWLCADAQNKWQLKREEDGIKVYTTSVDNCAFKSVKVECTIQATLTQLIAFLTDIERQPEWVYSTRSAKVIRKIRENELIFYSVVDVPWPATNRDYIAHFTINQPAAGLVTIDSRSEANLVPVNKGLVRVKYSLAHWDITTINNELLNVVYTVQFDPGGAVPAWLTNLFIVKGPMTTFKNMREKAKDPIYKNAHLDYIR